MKKRISDGTDKPARRKFLLGLGAAAAATTALRGRRSSEAVPAAHLPDVLRVPDRVSLFGEGKSTEINLKRSGNNWQVEGVEVATELRSGKAGNEAAFLLTRRRFL
jgi:hypothetical protein